MDPGHFPAGPAPGPADAPRRCPAAWLDAVAALGLGLATALVFAPALAGDFVGWDDTALIVRNPAYRGLGWSQLRWMATTVLTGHYVPVTWLSLALDYLIWGLRPAGYHLTNVLLHAGNAVLVFYLASRLLGHGSGLAAGARRWGAAVTALFFALHPLRVETVAWVTERRGVLSGFFFLATLHLYLRAVDAGGGRRRWLHGAAVAAFALALASKATVMPLPLLLLVLDVYPLRRVSAAGGWLDGGNRRLLVEKVPYLVVAVLGAGASFFGQRAGSEVGMLDLQTWLGKVGLSLWLLVQKTVLPTSLSPLYELPPRIRLASPPVVLSLAAVLAITAALVAARRRWPAGLAAWAWYVIALSPVLGVAHAGPQLIADRYSYLPGLAFAGLLGAAAAVLAQARAGGRLGRAPAAALAAAAGVGFLGLAALTWQQIGVWRSTDALWRHAARVSPGCTICRVNHGNGLARAGDPEGARREFEAALAGRPEAVEIRQNLAVALAALGRREEAVHQFEAVLARWPGLLGARLDLAMTLVDLGRRAEAVERLRGGLDHVAPAEAVAYFEDVVGREPANAVARVALVQAYRAAGRPDRAGAVAAVLARLDPVLAAAAAGPHPPGAAGPGR